MEGGNDPPTYRGTEYGEILGRLWRWGREMAFWGTKAAISLKREG